jgi:hypothetical protein
MRPKMPRVPEHLLWLTVLVLLALMLSGVI